MTKSLTSRQFSIGLTLLAVLPPVGIGWFIYLSRWQWLTLFRQPKTIRHDHVLLFILWLIGITSVNLLRSPWRQPAVLSGLLLIVLLNLWLLCRQSAQLLSWPQICHYLVCFGVYLTVSGNIFHWLNRWQLLPVWLKFLTGDLLWGYAANADRLFGSADNPNDACCILLIALAVVLAQISLRIGSGNHWRSRGVIALLMLGIYQTQSRTGLLLMLLMVLGTSFYLNWRRSLWLTGLIGSISWFTLTWSPRSYSWATGWTSRLTIWHHSLQVFAKAPWLGVSYFGFAPQYLNLTGHYVPHAHDIFIMVLASFGLLGGLGLISLIIANGWRLTRQWQPTLPDRRYFLLILAVILAYGVSDFVLSSPQVLMIILLVMAHWWHAQQAISVKANP